jgi:hypothetical protein
MTKCLPISKACRLPCFVLRALVKAICTGHSVGRALCYINDEFFCQLPVANFNERHLLQQHCEMRMLCKDAAAYSLMFTRSIARSKHSKLIVRVPSTSACAGTAHTQNACGRGAHMREERLPRATSAAHTSDHEFLNLPGNTRVRHGALCCLWVVLHVLEQVVDVGVGKNGLQHV